MLFGSLGFRVVFVAGALPPHPHKELSFLDLVYFERIAFKIAKVFGVPFLKKGNKKSLTTQDTKEPTFLTMTGIQTQMGCTSASHCRG
jgi:hypothetical protein